MWRQSRGDRHARVVSFGHWLHGAVWGARRENLVPRTCSPGRITTWPHDNRHWNRAARTLEPGDAMNRALVTLRTGAAVSSWSAIVEAVGSSGCLVYAQEGKVLLKGECMAEEIRWYENWNFKVRARDVTVRVALDGPGKGSLTGFQVIYGPSQIGLDIPVTSREDARNKVEALLCELMGRDWC